MCAGAMCLHPRLLAYVNQSVEFVVGQLPQPVRHAFAGHYLLSIAQPHEHRSFEFREPFTQR